MFPNYCGPMSFVGWLLMLLLWAGVVFLAVCGIARLFPDNRRSRDRAMPAPATPGEDTPETVDSGPALDPANISSERSSCTVNR